MKTLFPSVAKPEVTEVGLDDMPEAGPNATEVAALQYDPDSNILVVSLPKGVQAVYKLSDMLGAASFDMLLVDSKLGPKITVTVTPRTTMPSFGSPEEADAWLEANA